MMFQWAEPHYGRIRVGGPQWTPAPRAQAPLPGMGDCAGLARRHTWEFRSVFRGLARTAFVLELLLLILPDNSNRLLVYGIVRVLFHDLENLCRTRGHAISAAIAFVRINGNEIIS